MEQDPMGRVRQFQMVLDELASAWVLDRQGGGDRASYSDRVLRNVDGEIETEFRSSTASAQPVCMAMPELFPQWGPSERGGSFFPMLVQRVGGHSILVTFQHEADPAYRTTMVVDERDGIARRRYGRSEAIIVTDVRVMEDEQTPGRPRFSRPLGPIPADY
ncbi:hypothetical protein ACFOYW_09500 [Gryllotalpicola reticulitermitis]|uniref:Uncharacterized protein n=1 Tax=Gryllotalpicola reticulitermitis TaxID=1184153 RepID=A0ABV8Q820_9MICO